MPKPPSPETTFVRQHATKKPAEIVALAKAAGIVIDEVKVTRVRDYDRAQDAKRAKKGTAGPVPIRVEPTRIVEPKGRKPSTRKATPLVVPPTPSKRSIFHFSRSTAPTRFCARIVAGS
jgi:hypothetical protein